VKILLTKHEYHIGKAEVVRSIGIGLTSGGISAIVMDIIGFVLLRGLPADIYVEIYEALLRQFVAFLFVGTVMLILGIAILKQVGFKEESKDVVSV